MKDIHDSRTTVSPITATRASRVPWQLEWKHPQWISTKRKSTAGCSCVLSKKDHTQPIDTVEDDIVDVDDGAPFVVIGVTTAQLSMEEFSWMMVMDGVDDVSALLAAASMPTTKNTSLLLSVTLLGRHSDNNNNNDNDDDDDRTSPPALVASQVLLEILMESNKEKDNEEMHHHHHEQKVKGKEKEKVKHHYQVIRSKRLQWPDENIVRNHHHQPPPPQRQRKNGNPSMTFVKGLRALFAIQEDDLEDDLPPSLPPAAAAEASSSFTTTASATSSTTTTTTTSTGLLSATLCRRSVTSTSMETNAMDLISLMNLNLGMGEGIVTSSSSSSSSPLLPSLLPFVTPPPPTTTTTTTTASLHTPFNNHKEDDNNNNNNNNNDDDTNTMETILKESKTRLPSVVNQELCLVCLTTSGHVFVYNPFQLFNGGSSQKQQQQQQQQQPSAQQTLHSPQPQPHHNHNHHNDDDDDFSKYFLGNDLFQTLQEQYKPLAEPMASILLTVVQHDASHNKQHHSSTGTTHRTHRHIMTKEKEIFKQEDDDDEDDRSSILSSAAHASSTNRRGFFSSIACPPSNTPPPPTPQASSTATTTTAAAATTTTTKRSSFHQHHYSPHPHNLLLDPFLFNSFFEPSTIHHRTSHNRPLTIQTVDGKSSSPYLIVTGKGIPYYYSTGQSVQQHSGLRNRHKNNQHTTTTMSKNQSSSTLQTPWWESSKDLLQLDPASLSSSSSSSSSSSVHDGNHDNDHDDQSSLSKSTTTNDHRDNQTKQRAKQQQPQQQTQVASSKIPKGGFVTFISTTHWSEVRTLFLPFVPTSVSHIPKWNNDMEWVMVMGTHDAVLIRIDSKGPMAIPIETISQEPPPTTTTTTTTTLSCATAAVPTTTSKTTTMTTTSSSEPSMTIPDVGSNAGFVAPPASSSSSRSSVTETQHNPSYMVVKKFQVLTVDLFKNARYTSSMVDDKISHWLLCGSGTGVEPPSLLEMFVDNTSNYPQSQQPQQQHALVLLKTLSHCTVRGTVALHHEQSRVAKITITAAGTEATDFFSSENIRNNTNKSHRHCLLKKESVWAQHGQGWSLLGTKDHDRHLVYLICWEGATLSQGAYVQEFSIPHWHLQTITNKLTNSRQRVVHATQVLQLASSDGTVTRSSVMPQFHQTLSSQNEEDMDQVNRSVALDPRRSMSAMIPRPFLSPYESDSMADTNNGSADDDAEMNVIFRAIKDLSISRRSIVNDSSIVLSHEQKSEQLLQHCSSWAQLQDTVDDRIVLERQEPVLFLRSAAPDASPLIFTLRQLVVKNGQASPFQQVLAWLAKKGNYFTAASVALDLLQDGETLFHLWKQSDMIDEQEEKSKLDGLLDGILPIRLVTSSGLGTEGVRKNTSIYVVHLADMTVACLIKGGFRMSKTLRHFLRKNTFYDPARASLMLAAATAAAVSRDKEVVASVMGGMAKNSHDDRLWPVECLLEIGVSRDYLETSLLLLNATIPDELRQRQDRVSCEEAASTIQYSNKLDNTMTKKLVTLIIGSDSTAVEILLNLVDEYSRVRYWQSLHQDTQLSLSLIEIKSLYPLIRNPEIRAWLREELNMCIKKETTLPTIWLQELCLACLKNAGCDLNDLEIDDAGQSSSMPDESINVEEELEDGLYNHKLEISETQNALTSSTNYSVDYDLLIPCLLLLQLRSSSWQPLQQAQNPGKRYVSTQSLLNASCHLAGRSLHTNVLTKEKLFDTSDEKPYLFAAFDSTTAMKQCFLANNVSAGASLIGGKNGFILHVCQILMQVMAISMSDAESFIVSDELDLRFAEESKKECTSFELTDSHRRLLWLLDEHVLSVKTFGQFETIHIRGRVDPVFAARSVLRTWLAISYGDKDAASTWLCKWLASQLQLHESCTHRLACAALARSLVWPSSVASSKEDEPMGSALGSAMEIEITFLVEICKSCVGLVESVPPCGLDTQDSRCV